jgi:hypothetical protein
MTMIPTDPIWRAQDSGVLHPLLHFSPEIIIVACAHTLPCDHCSPCNDPSEEVLNHGVFDGKIFAAVLA